MRTYKADAAKAVIVGQEEITLCPSFHRLSVSFFCFLMIRSFFAFGSSSFLVLSTTRRVTIVRSHPPAPPLRFFPWTSILSGVFALDWAHSGWSGFPHRFGIDLSAPKPAMRCFGFFSFEQTKLCDFGVCSKTTRMLETLETPPAVLRQLEQSMNALCLFPLPGGQT